MALGAVYEKRLSWLIKYALFYAKINATFQTGLKQKMFHQTYVSSQSQSDLSWESSRFALSFRVLFFSYISVIMNIPSVHAVLGVKCTSCL